MHLWHADNLLRMLWYLGADGGFQQPENQQQEIWGDFTSAGPSTTATAPAPAAK